jgi:hypothetical protein
VLDCVSHALSNIMPMIYIHPPLANFLLLARHVRRCLWFMVFGTWFTRRFIIKWREFDTRQENNPM